jgi:hypothetical protein
VTITITPVKDPIDAVNDAGAIVVGTVGGTSFTNVLANDTLYGLPISPGAVVTTGVSSTNPGVSLDGTNVVVAPGTPAGNYTLTYQICETLDPDNCDTATVTVPVIANAPTTTFGIPGTTTYSASTDLFSVSATPLAESFGTPIGNKQITTPRSLSINIYVDGNGVVTGGVTGDDFVLTGAIAGTTYSGVLLTGEILGFTAQNTSTTDVYTFRFRVTGGALAPLYAGQDIIVRLTSESSTFTGSFATNFSGQAKGTVGPIAPNPQ